MCPNLWHQRVKRHMPAIGLSRVTYRPSEQENVPLSGSKEWTVLIHVCRHEGGQARADKFDIDHRLRMDAHHQGASWLLDRFSTVRPVLDRLGSGFAQSCSSIYSWPTSMIPNLMRPTYGRITPESKCRVAPNSSCNAMQCASSMICSRCQRARINPGCKVHCA